jgi:hypothetical protein
MTDAQRFACDVIDAKSKLLATLRGGLRDFFEKARFVAADTPFLRYDRFGDATSTLAEAVDRAEAEVRGIIDALKVEVCGWTPDDDETAPGDDPDPDPDGPAYSAAGELRRALDRLAEMQAERAAAAEASPAAGTVYDREFLAEAEAEMREAEAAFVAALDAAGREGVAVGGLLYSKAMGDVARAYSIYPDEVSITTLAKVAGIGLPA